jgi:hypothetical protein
MKKYLLITGTGANLAACILILAAITVACIGIKKPWRDYSPKPFSSAEWLAGDKIERGRMSRDMFRNPKVEIGSRDLAIKTLGEPDLKRTIEKSDVWFYRVDQGIVDAMDLIPVSFDENGRGHVGYAHGGTMSIMAKEEELK